MCKQGILANTVNDRRTDIQKTSLRMVYRAATSYQMCKQGILADSVNDRQTDIQKTSLRMVYRAATMY